MKNLIFSVSAAFPSAWATETKENHDSWAVIRCALNLLPPSYYTDNENSKISGFELGPAEIAKFSREAPEGLSDALREEVGKLWPDKIKFQRSLGRHIEESASDFAFNLARNLSNRFQLDACGVRNDIEMTMVSVLSDKVSGIFRGNGVYDAIPMGPPGRAYLVMMAAGRHHERLPECVGRAFRDKIVGYSSASSVPGGLPMKTVPGRGRAFTRSSKMSGRA